MNTLKINIPEGHVVDKFDEKEGVLSFKLKPKSIRERLNTTADIFEYHGITEEQFSKKWEGHEPDEVGYAWEKMIVSAYNEGKLPDWTDGTYKYWPYFKMPSPAGVGFSFDGHGTWLTLSFVGSRLVFVGPEAKANMLDAVNKFLPQYEQSRTS